MATFKPIVFSTKNHIKTDGTTNIKFRLYHNKQSQYIPTEYYIEPSYMNSGGEISSLHPASDLFNYELGEITQKYRKAVLKLGSSRLSNMSCSELRDYIVDASRPDYNFIDFVAFSLNVIAETDKEKTAEWYQTSLNSFIWFFGKNKIDARDITRKKIKDWMKQLKKAGQSGKPLKPGAISNYVRGLRALYNLCKSEYNDEDYDLIRIPNKPFDKEDIPVYRRMRRNISIEDLLAIRDYKSDLKRVNMSRDIFMMMFYLMGININDLYKSNEPVRGRLDYERSKTDTDDNSNNFVLSINIEPELSVLIDKYSSNGFLSDLKRYSNVKNITKAVNIGLSVISEDLNLPKITTNWARHSWATIARNKAKIHKADVDFCLGHVNNDYKMADIYIDIDYSICDEANRAVLNLLL